MGNSSLLAEAAAPATLLSTLRISALEMGMRFTGCQALVSAIEAFDLGKEVAADLRCSNLCLHAVSRAPLGGLR